MKKLFIAVWFIIAILLIPLIYDAVDNAMTQVDSISISFELTPDEDSTSMGSVTAGTYDELIQYVESDLVYLETGEALHINLFVNDTPVDMDLIIYKDANNNSIILAELPYWDASLFYLQNDDTFQGFLLPVEENMNIRIEFETQEQTNGLWSVLLSLIPLVFVGGLIVYFVKKNDLNA